MVRQICPEQQTRTQFDVPTVRSQETQGTNMESHKLRVKIGFSRVDNKVSKVDNKELRHTSPTFKSIKNLYKSG